MLKYISQLSIDISNMQNQISFFLKMLDIIVMGIKLVFIHKKSPPCRWKLLHFSGLTEPDIYGQMKKCRI